MRLANLYIFLLLATAKNTKTFVTTVRWATIFAGFAPCP